MATARVRDARSRARRTISALLALVLALAFGSRGAQAITAADFKKVGEDTFDLLILRPSGAVALAVGSVFFAASVPFVAPYPAIKNGSIEGIRGSYDIFVYPPYEYTVLRDLGDF